MLSDLGLKRAMKEGRLVIDPFDERYLGPCSYDLEMQRIYRVKRPEKPFVIGGSEDDVPMERFIEDECEAYDGVLLPSETYIGVSKEKILAVPYTQITTRSSAARLGIQTSPIKEGRAEFDHMYFAINTCGTICEMPISRRLSQLFLPFGSYVSKPVLRLGGKIKRYNGGILHPDRNNNGCFSEIDITTPYYLASGNFYLAYTEWMKCPDNVAGMLVKIPEHRGMCNIHPNAPLIAPGSEGHQVLEIYLAEGLYVKVKEGQPICEVEFWPLDQNPQNAYNGKYKGQRGPQTSLFHTEGA